MILSGALLVGALVASSVGPCLANADTAHILTQQVRQTFAFLDSVRLREQGLPIQVDRIGLVSDSMVCVRAIEALNAPEQNPSATKAKRAYVFSLDSAAYVVTPADDVNTFTYFDRSWRWLAGLVALD